MTDTTLSQNKLQWKWIGISFLLYLVFYLAPLSLMVSFFAGPSSPTAVLFISGWSFAGILIVAGAITYWSKGRTFWEPCIAALVLVAFIFFVLRPILVPKEFELHNVSVISSRAADIVFAILLLLLSFVGSWLGMRIWKAQHPVTG